MNPPDLAYLVELVANVKRTATTLEVFTLRCDRSEVILYGDRLKNQTQELLGYVEGLAR